MMINGSITELKVRHAASGDMVKSAKLELHGDFVGLHEFLNKPLRITIEVDNDKPE